MEQDKDYPPKTGILPQYVHLRGIEENMPVIRKILGLPEYGEIPQTTVFGRVLQKFAENSGKSNVYEGECY